MMEPEEVVGLAVRDDVLADGPWTQSSRQSEPAGAGRDRQDPEAIVPMATDEDTPDLTVLAQRLAELEQQLRERVAENVVLNDEVRCLLAERRVRDEYIGSIEEAWTKLPEVEGELAEARADLTKHLDWTHHTVMAYEEALTNERRLFAEQLDAYRNRTSTKALDKTVGAARRIPGVTGLMRRLRALIRPPAAH